jgi:hypothetical protein
MSSAPHLVLPKPLPAMTSHIRYSPSGASCFLRAFFSQSV